jgi:pSer/pThr/pTyr-binding forkhead associated (FHA) protein
MNAGANAGARFELSLTEPNLLGRDWQCLIVLNDPQCSRVHAEVYRNEEGWWVRDRDSSNGTYVNGQIANHARVMDGTEVRIGASLLTFSDGELPTPNPPQSELGTDHRNTTNQTVVFDESMNPRETGQYTLDFLKGHNWGKDFFFLFQLSVKLLAVDDPDEVCVGWPSERRRLWRGSFGCRTMVN